ncbi:MAG: hypothetical protein L3J83_01875 [Proteobacteria bacterium]|nr:hypothetical protein [Pseudomonadota bacterium]
MKKYLFILLMLSFNLLAKEVTLEKFTTADFIEYFNHETCYDYLHTLSLSKVRQTLYNYNQKKYENLRTNNSKNRQNLYRLIKNQCNEENTKFFNSKLIKYSKYQMITNLSPETKLEHLADKIYCDKKTNADCSYTLNNNELEEIFHSSDIYIHELFRFSFKKYFKNNLSYQVAKHLKTGNSTLAYYLLKDAYILYQCDLGRDCSATSPYMIEKCFIDEEFCGLDVESYLKHYKHSPSQHLDVLKTKEFIVPTR